MKENSKRTKVKLTTIILALVIITIIVIVLIILNKKNDNKNNEESKTPVQTENKIADTNFSFEFLKIENNKKNIIYSPLSIKYALQMLNYGANGNTKTQIANVIGSADLEKYNNINNILSLANALYIRDTYKSNVKDEYKNILLNKYNAEIKYDSFKSTDNINKWIENKTFGQIKNMLQDKIVTNTDNKMFLINALAIDMEWKNKFQGENTHGDTFYLENGEEITTTMMNQETKSDDISYYKDNDITAISMDLKQYKNEQMEFIAIMPNNDLPNYVENFRADTLKNITTNLTLASKTKNGLNISIPRFSFDYNLNLKEDLKILGITDAFDSNLADFSSMSSEDIYVADALHKANIDFTEKGVKAAATTVIYMTEGIAIDEDIPIEIKIDKPFMYLIKDKKTNEIWFTGTVYEPNLWDNDKADYEYR